MSFPRLALRRRSFVLLASTLCAAALAADPEPLQNGGFEEGVTGWNASAQDAALGLSKVSAEAAHSGTAGLRVKQETGGPGSWLQSPRYSVEGGKTYRFGFWARCVEESGIGVWIQFYDADRKNIAQPSPMAIQVQRNATDWKEYSMDAQVPPNAAAMTFAVHSYSKQPCLADFDDFSLRAIDAAAIAVPTPNPPRKPVPPLPQPDAARVKEIAALLDAAPRGVGSSIDNRAPWEALGANEAYRTLMLERAGRFMNEPLPEVSLAAYAASGVSGDRAVDKNVDRRRFRLATFVLAEGMENKGRFLPAIDKEILAICAEPGWILSGHVKFSHRNDLGTAMTAWNLATAVTMLGNRLPEPTRKSVHDEVMKRAVQPFLDELHGKATPPEFWRVDPNNWNAVVHGGITGAALALADSVQDRAEIVAAAEKETLAYIQGFPADGYSGEGMGYWKYGFGHYVMLSETVLAATHGKVNLYAKDSIRLVAQFPRRFEIVPGVYPAYSDSLFLEEPSPWLFHIVERRYGLGDRYPRAGLDGMFSGFLYAHGINMAFDSSAAPLAMAGAAPAKGPQLRDWFEQSQVLVTRMPEGQDGLNASIKGGNNGTSHCHLDLGSYVVVLGKQPILIDPGSPVYNATTMGPNAWGYQVKNSYGHSVPKVAGQLQKPGAAYQAAVVSTRFSADTDTLTLDLKKGYEVPSLLDLTRTYAYSRAGRGSLTVSDRAAFRAPEAFGTAVVTYGEAKEEKQGVWTVTYKGQTVRIEINTEGAPFTVTDELLKDESRIGKVRRLGIDLANPSEKAAITVKITPVL